MNSQDIVIRILDSGDALLNSKLYREAYFEYEQIFPIISALQQKNTRADKIGSIAGWTAGLLTGGLGFEDILLIPFVSKVAAKGLGSDNQYTSQILSMVILRQVNCILSSHSLAENIEKEKTFGKFAVIISLYGDSKLYTKIINAFLPGVMEDSSAPNSDVHYTPYYFLLDTAQKMNLDQNEIYNLLWLYLKKIKDTSELSLLLQSIFSETYEGTRFTDHENTSQYTSKDYNEILGIKHGASKEEIKKAYYEKMKQYHPDKFAHLSKEFQELANKKAKAINEAYNYLMK